MLVAVRSQGHQFNVNILFHIILPLFSVVQSFLVIVVLLVELCQNLSFKIELQLY